MSADLVLTGMSEVVLRELRGRATSHGRSPAEEAEAILSEVLDRGDQKVWAQVDAICQRLAESGRAFSDSADILREERDR